MADYAFLLCNAMLSIVHTAFGLSVLWLWFCDSAKKFGNQAVRQNHD